MLQFLMLFPTFRNLLESRNQLRAAHDADHKEVERLRGVIQDLQHEKLMLQDRLDAATEDRSKLWGLASECIGHERVAYQMQVNAQWQKQGFGAPYPDAPQLPQSAVPSNEPVEGPKRPVFMSSKMARATNDFVEELVKGRQPAQPA